MHSLGFVSAILPDLDLDEVFDVAVAYDYDCIEVMCWPLGKAQRRYAGVTHLDCASLDDAKVASIRERVKRTGVQISSLGYYPNPLSSDTDEAKTAVDHLRLVMEASARLGIHRITTFVGRDWTRSVDDNWPRFLDTWGPLLDHADSLDVAVGIENCPMLFTADEWPGGKNLACSPVIWRRMFDAFPSARFGLNYDPSHLAWMQMDPVEPLVEFASRLHHVHAKDVRVDRQKLNENGVLAFPNDYHCPKLPGMGEVDWGRFFSVLTDVGYTGPVCVEVEDRAYEGCLEHRKLALAQSASYLRQFIPKPLRA
ncbi:MAG: sugar phosphate isomerase/epimerase family protein [Planctomycetota bacterium]